MGFPVETTLGQMRFYRGPSTYTAAMDISNEEEAFVF
jgi:hypothetical protein